MINKIISMNRTEQLLIAMALTKYAEELVEDGPSKDNKKMVKSICDLLDRIGYHDRANKAWTALRASE